LGGFGGSKIHNYIISYSKMLKRYFFIVVAAGLLAPGAYAQKSLAKSSATQSAAGKGLAHVSRQELEAHLFFLASDALAGREAGKPGGRVAAEYIKAALLAAGVKPFYGSYFQPFEAYSLRREKRVDFQVHPDSIAKYRQNVAYRRLKLQNVLGYVEGQRKDEYVVIGAHYDHIGADDLLVGDRIYNGADDNASGVAVALQVAKAAAAAGQKPLRSIIFAFWDGEEVNYLGSEYFVAGFAQPSNIKAYINLDMVGRQGVLPILHPSFALPNGWDKLDTAVSKDVYFLRTEELASFSEQLGRDVEQLEPNIAPKPSVLVHKSEGSDNLAFSLRAIPVLWFFTGIHPEYHTPADEAEKVNLDKLTGIAKATFLSLWRLADLEEDGRKP
jgi:Zn-dependent M28 family amino/carboxypeptidase